MPRKHSYTGFKPAKELGLSGAEKKAFVFVLKALDHGDITDDITARKPCLRMPLVLERHDACGTVGCLAGHIAAALFRGQRYSLPRLRPKARTFYYTAVSKNEALCRLFIGRDLSNVSYMSGSVTTAQAARALRSFLRTGEPHWEKTGAAQV